MVFLKEFFEKLILKKNQQTTKKYENYSRQRVNNLYQNLMDWPKLSFPGFTDDQKEKKTLESPVVIDDEEEKKDVKKEAKSSGRTTRSSSAATVKKVQFFSC